MPKLNRWLVVKGEWYTVEYAVRSDGSSPARSFMDLLKEGEWRDDPEPDTFPSDEQISDWAKFMDQMSYFARHGEPQRRTQLNHLRDGLWEFKVANKRLTFFDTPGDGTYAPKPKLNERVESPYPESDFWWVPEFDETLRLANSWPKVGEKADPIDIAEGLQIREEDIDHDR